MSEERPDRLSVDRYHQFVRHRARGQFDRWADSYDRSWLNELVFFPAVRACQEEIARWQATQSPGSFRLLDVGCGTGALITRIAAQAEAALAVGADYSPVMLRHAAAKIAASPHGEKLRTIQADAERLPFADASFDVVTCCNSFHHYPRQAEAVLGFRRVLRPGGLLILIDGFRDNVVGWVVFDVAVALIERHVHHARWWEVRDMLRAAGFARVCQRKLNVLAPLLVSVAIR